MFEWYDPVALELGPLTIKWYGISYIAGIFLALSWARYLCASQNYPQFSYTKHELENYLSYGILGIIIGGRLGYCLFYTPMIFIDAPLDIFKVWEGGMAFHGGLIGVGLFSYFFVKKNRFCFARFSDLWSLCAPLGFFCGRIANYINAEHFGHPTSLPWGVVFPGGGPFPRHPSQLYEAFLEGTILFILLNILQRHCPKLFERPGIMTGFFLIGYSLMRMVCEFFRVPETHLDIFPLSLTYGHILSLLQIFFALFWLQRCKKT